MWVVLCDPGDRSGLWAYAGLRKRGLAPLELITPHELAYSTWSVHNVGARGSHFEIALARGGKLVSDEIKGVLNRLAEVPTDHLIFGSDDETHYAIQEVNALVLSWMACIGPVSINRATARGLAGTWRSPAEWTLLAAKAGLPVSMLRVSSECEAGLKEPLGGARSFIVLGKRVFGGELPRPISEACIRLANMAETHLLGIDFFVDRDQIRFTNATPMPDLRIGGVEFVDHLHGCLIGLPSDTT